MGRNEDDLDLFKSLFNAFMPIGWMDGWDTFMHMGGWMDGHTFMHMESFMHIGWVDGWTCLYAYWMDGWTYL